MISFRNHLVSIVAIFVALAVGIILGGGPLSEFGRGGDTEQAAQASSASSSLHATFGDEFAAATAASLYGDRLQGQQVAVVTLAGADADIVDGVTEQITAAGGSVAATYEGREKLTVPDEQGYVESLGTQLVDDNDLGDTIPSDLTSHERIGRLLGRAIASTEPNGAESDVTAQTILDTLANGELVTAGQDSAGLVPYVVVVMGEEREDAAATALLAGLTEGLAGTSAGEVVVASTASGEDGDLALLRDEDIEGFSTVDGADTEVGQVTTALAVAALRDGTVGAYGASGADGAVPVS